MTMETPNGWTKKCLEDAYDLGGLQNSIDTEAMRHHSVGMCESSLGKWFWTQKNLVVKIWQAVKSEFCVYIGLG